jgi:hypothetical protein
LGLQIGVSQFFQLLLLPSRTQKSASVHTKALSVAPLAWIQEELNQTEGFLDQTSPRFTPVISYNGCSFVQANELLKHLWISDTP